MRDVKIGEIVQVNQPGLHKQLNNKTYKKKKRKRRDKEHLSFYDIEELMGVHGPIYKRHRGALRQKSWGK